MLARAAGRLPGSASASRCPTVAVRPPTPHARATLVERAQPAAGRRRGDERMSTDGHTARSGGGRAGVWRGGLASVSRCPVMRRPCTGACSSPTAARVRTWGEGVGSPGTRLSPLGQDRSGTGGASTARGSRTRCGAGGGRGAQQLTPPCLQACIPQTTPPRGGACGERAGDCADCRRPPTGLVLTHAPDLVQE